MFDGRGAPFNGDKIPLYSFNDVDVMRDPTWFSSALFYFITV